MDIGIIGGADGPTSIYVSGSIWPLVAVVAVIAAAIVLLVILRRRRKAK